MRVRVILIFLLITLLVSGMCYKISYSRLNYDKIENKHPKISVVMPVYNAERFLLRSVSSVLNQTFKDFELICINDGSTDKSLKILMTFAQKNNNMRVFSQRNKGAGRARNRGLSKVRGDYVIFLDADDKFDERLLEIMYDKAIKTDSDIVMCHSNYVVNNKITGFDMSIAGNLLPDKDVFNRKDFKYIINFTNGEAWDKFCKKDFIDKYNLQFSKFKNSEDLNFGFRAVAVADKITTVDEKLVTYYPTHPNSVSKKRDKYYTHPLLAYLQLKKDLEKDGIYKEVEQSYINRFVDFMLWHYGTISSKSQAKFVKVVKKHLPELNFSKFDESYFYNLDEYHRFKDVFGI